jgi:hypothetical protein
MRTPERGVLTDIRTILDSIALKEEPAVPERHAQGEPMAPIQSAPTPAIGMAGFA